MTDVILRGASEIVTCDPALGRIERGAIVIEGERVAWVGRETDLRARPGATQIDASGFAVVPGFVDAHTHLVFAGHRREEFSARAEGRPYKTAGILDSVAATRAATKEELLDAARVRAGHMLGHGTTTAEAKSGYALDVEGERRLLEVLAELDRTHPLDLEITFLGAHAVPEGTPADEYVELVCREMTPACAPLARWCDVFCDTGAFTAEQSERVLRAGMAAGLTPRIHANELASSGGAGVAAALGAASADHLLYLDPGEAKALAAAGCVGVVCPVTALGLGRFPDVRRMEDAGMTLALASDLNPGMAPAGNLQFAMAVATRAMGMGAERALRAATAGGAAALRRTDIGRIAPGCLADVVVLATDSHLDLGYQAGANLAHTVIKRGRVVATQPPPVPGALRTEAGC